MSEVPVRAAATLVLLRETEQGLETLMLRRHSRLEFAGGAWVFPGGAVEEGDHGGDEEQVARRAAVRETLEECGLVVEAGELVPFAHWTTPPQAPKRYATWFFAARAGEGTVRVDGDEIDHHGWYTPSEALAEHRAGRIELMPPTFVTLTELTAVSSAQAALERWRDTPLLRIEPRVAFEGDAVCMLYPGDAGYAETDPARSGPRHRCVMAPDGWCYQRDT